VARKAPTANPATIVEIILIIVFGTNDIASIRTEIINTHSPAQFHEKIRPKKSPIIMPSPSMRGTMETWILF
jgi:hypothetical protein